MEYEPIRAVHTERVELHLHTKLSCMDGLCDVEDTVKLAHRMGHRAIAVTDHGVVQAFPAAMRAVEKIHKTDPDFKLIYGVEIYLIERAEAASGSSHACSKKNTHLTILVKNQVGLKNLYRIISASHIDYFFRVPCVPRSLLAQYREGLLIGSACEAGELYRAVVAGRCFEELCEIAADYDFLEVQPIGNNAYMVREKIVNDIAQLQVCNNTVIRLGEVLGLPVVATGDVHFLRPEDAVCRAVLKAGMGFPDADNQPPLYLRTTREMLEQFHNLSPEKAFEIVVENPNKLADSICNDLCAIPKEFCISIPEDAPPLVDSQLCCGRVVALQKAAAYTYVKAYLVERGLAVSHAEEKRMVQGCVGVKRSTRRVQGRNVAVPSSYGVSDFCPIQYSANNKTANEFITHFDLYATAQENEVYEDE